MELQQIVERYAEALEAIDGQASTLRANQRTGEVYLGGVKSLGEPRTVKAVDAEWDRAHPGEFLGAGPRIGVRYPTIARTKCDHAFTTDAPNASEPEWAIEVKHVALVGNNGKNGDHESSKMLSPYLKDRGLIHDVARLKYHPLARRHAVIGYGFGHDLASCDEALRRHPKESGRIDAMRKVVTKNGGSLELRPLIDFAESILLARGMIHRQRAETTFEAWQHPCGGHGVVFGWEVRRPELEPGFDPRHPW